MKKYLASVEDIKMFTPEIEGLLVIGSSEELVVDLLIAQHDLAGSLRKVTTIKARTYVIIIRLDAERCQTRSTLNL